MALLPKSGVHDSDRPTYINLSERWESKQYKNKTNMKD